jgi:hypothetical protein
MMKRLIEVMPNDRNDTINPDDFGELLKIYR